MGRTKRKRRRKLLSPHHPTLDNDPTTVNLVRFMTHKGWANATQLKLRHFQDTGRGVSSTQTVHPQDVLVEVPYHLMVTYSTIMSLQYHRLLMPNARLKMQDLLSLFLVVERHKKESVWCHYINSLPVRLPPLLCLLRYEQIETLPAQVRSCATKSRQLMKESWRRIMQSIRVKELDCVLDFTTFAWAFALVNTRAVYVDPKLVCDVKCDNVLLDEPCMALCPFLDMFNHHHEAKTEARLTIKDEKLVFELTTLRAIKRHKQIFISYGPHDNLRLLTDYGFFIPGNCHDCVHFQSEEIMDVLNHKLDSNQYRFVQEHGLFKTPGLYISKSGASFYLQGLLFVVLHGHCKNFASVVYGGSYSSDFLDVVNDWCRKLLQHKQQSLTADLDLLLGSELDIYGVKALIVDYINYLKQFIDCMGIQIK